AGRAERAPRADLARALRDPETGHADDAERSDREQREDHRTEADRHRTVPGVRLLAHLLHAAQAADDAARIGFCELLLDRLHDFVAAPGLGTHEVAGVVAVGHVGRYQGRVLDRLAGHPRLLRALDDAD